MKYFKHLGIKNEMQLVKKALNSKKKKKKVRKALNLKSIT